MHVAAFFAVVLSIGHVHCGPLHVHLSIQNRFTVGQEVDCKLTITNGGGEDVFLFHSGTPVEGLISDSFKITRNGLPVDYDGPFYKRQAVNSQSEGTTLKSNGTVSVTVDLSSAYEVGRSGTYIASLSTKIYFREGDGVIVKAKAQSKPVQFVVEGEDSGSLLTSGQRHRLNREKYTVDTDKAAAGAPRSVSFLGSYDSVDASEASDAWSRAYSRVTQSISDMSTNPNHYKYWFGIAPTSTPWSGTFKLVKNAMEQDAFQLYFRAPDCKPNVFAYTYKGTRVIYLCDGYLYAQAYGFDSKFGTLVHEMTHAVVGTEDFAYGEDDCLYLAKTNPTKAVMNADNYEFFVESL